MAPPVYALGTLAFGTLVGDMLVRKRVVRALFNAAVLVISLGAGIAFLEAIQLREALVGQGSVPLEFVPACALFAVVVFSTNLFFLVPVLRVETRLGVRSIIRRVLPQSGARRPSAPGVVTRDRRGRPSL